MITWHCINCNTHGLTAPEADKCISAEHVVRQEPAKATCKFEDARIMTAPDTSLTGASAQERETDKAFVERMRKDGLTISFNENDYGDLGESEATRDFARLIALAARGAAVPDAGAEPAAWQAKDDGDGKWYTFRTRQAACDFCSGVADVRPLYAAPPAAPAQTESEAYRAGMMRAARDVANELEGMLTAFEDELRGAIGNTNYTVLRDKLEVLRTEAASAVPSDPRGDGWRDDPSADDRWNAGCQFAMDQLCEAIGVDPKSVCWDAATETLDGDVQAVIWNILRARLGEDWSLPPAPGAKP